MSRFYANIQGNRGEATRQGTTNSGLYGHISGWDVTATLVDGVPMFVPNPELLTKVKREGGE